MVSATVQLKYSITNQSQILSMTYRNIVFDQIDKITQGWVEKFR